MALKSINVSEREFENCRSLYIKQRDFFVNIPLTQNFFDNLTLLAPAVWEVLISESAINNVVEFKSYYDFLTVPPKLFLLCEKLKGEVILQADNSRMQISILPSELALIYTL